MIRFDRRTFIATGAATAAVASPSAIARPVAQGDAALKATLDAIFNDDILHSPETATSLGLDKGALAPLKARLSPRTAAERNRELARDRKWLKRVRGFDPGKLGDAARLWREQVIYDLEQKIVAPARFAIGSVQRPYRIFQQGGSYFSVPDFLDSQHTIETAADAGAYPRPARRIRHRARPGYRRTEGAIETRLHRSGLVDRLDAGADEQAARPAGRR